MPIAFVVRDELLPVRNGYHSTGVNLLRQLAELDAVRCIHLGSDANPNGPTAQWCAGAGVKYNAAQVTGMPLLDGSEGVLASSFRAGGQALRTRSAAALTSLALGASGERVVVFTTGWDAASDIVASFDAGGLCFPADSITLFERKRLLSGARTLLRPLRVALASWREKRMLRAGYGHISYVTDVDADCARELNSSTRKHVVVTPIGINPEDFATAPTMQQRVATYGELLLFSGTLKYLPNRDAATRLATQILPRLTRTSARVRLVGSGGEVLAALAGPRLEIAGWAPSLIEELEHATLFVAPVRMGAGAKNNVLQALAAGTPVIGTPSCFAGFASTPPGAIVCDSDDDFAHEIETLLADVNRLDQMSAMAREFALANCTWQQAARALVAHLGTA